MELPNDIEGLRRMLLKVLDDLQAVKAENAFLKAENAWHYQRHGCHYRLFAEHYSGKC